jgi:hypothetical protein
VHRALPPQGGASGGAFAEASCGPPTSKRSKKEQESEQILHVAIQACDWLDQRASKQAIPLFLYSIICGFGCMYMCRLYAMNAFERAHRRSSGRSTVHTSCKLFFWDKCLSMQGKSVAPVSRCWTVSLVKFLIYWYISAPVYQDSRHHRHWTVHLSYLLWTGQNPQRHQTTAQTQYALASA